MVEAPSPIEIFERKAIRRNRMRARPALKDHSFLIDWAGDQLLERLKDIKREFPRALQMGLRCSDEFSDALADITNTQSLLKMDCALQGTGPTTFLAEDDFLPIAPESLDLILNLFNLHSVNDLPGALLQIRKALKADGLFLAAMLGGESLHELRSVLTETELDLKGGLSPRIHPFADKQDMGALLQRAGYALPVVDSEIVSVTYDNLFKLLADLRGMGEGNALVQRNKTPPGRDFFMRAADTYAQKFAESDGRIVATFEVIFLIGWAPHQSQQKPLKPGSAKHRLADALGTHEIKAGEKP